LWPLIVNTDPQKMTLSAGLASLQGQRLTDFPVLMAGALMASIPMIILFSVMQRQFISSIATTGVKG
ncbi:MAG: carbohydrate ABC transporter permease, partial [Jiangellaceae bacterium]